MAKFSSLSYLCPGVAAGWTHPMVVLLVGRRRAHKATQALGHWHCSYPGEQCMIPGASVFPWRQLCCSIFPPFRMSSAQISHESSECRESNIHLVLCSGSSWDPEGTPKHPSDSAKVSRGRRSVSDSTFFTHTFLLPSTQV